MPRPTDTTCARPPTSARSATEPLVPPHSSSARFTGSPASTRSTRSTRATSPASSTPATAIPTPPSSPRRSPRSKGPRPGSSAPRGWRPSRPSCSACSDRATSRDLRRPLRQDGRPRRPRAGAVRDRSTRSSTPTRPETLRERSAPRTRLVFVETLSNPLVRLADIAGLAEIFAATAGATLVVDHTFAPLLCRPLELGADAVIHSLHEADRRPQRPDARPARGRSRRSRPRRGRRLGFRPDRQPVRELAGPAGRRDPGPSLRPRLRQRPGPGRAPGAIIPRSAPCTIRACRLTPTTTAPSRAAPGRLRHDR